MIEIPETIPAGMKYYNYFYEYKGHLYGGGFVGTDPGAVYDTEPLRSKPGAKVMKVEEVTREEFIKTMTEAEQDVGTRNFMYNDPSTYGYRKTDRGWEATD